MTAHELRLLLTEKTLWRLLFKTALAVLAFLLVWVFDFNPLWVLFIILLFAGLYFREVGEKSTLKYSFFLLPLVFLLVAGFINPDGGLAVFGVVLVLFFLLFAVFGLINLFFRDRFLVYGILNTALLLSYFLFFFYFARGGENFWVLGPVLFVSTFLLSKEALIFFNFSGGRRASLFAGVFSLISLEFFHISQFLPFGFVNAAAYLALFLLLGKDLAVSATRGDLTFSFMMKQVTLFSVLTIVIFAASSW